MAENKSDVLYYPNFNPGDLAGIKQSLLLYDHVNVIAPMSTPILGSLLADSSGADLTEISRTGALDESYQVTAEPDVFRLIPDDTIIQNRRDEFLAALEEDLRDPEVLAWEQRWQARRGGKTYDWFVLPSYFGGNPPEIRRTGYQIQPFTHPQIAEPLLRVPFLVGMSIGLSEALWAAVDQGLTLYTDDDTSEQFLLLRLQRGWKRLSNDPAIQRAFGLEPAFAQKYAVGYLGSRVLRAKVPRLIQQTAAMPIAEIVQLRSQSNRSDALQQFRAGLADLIESDHLWNTAKFRDFENEAYQTYAQKILPAFEELEGQRAALKDVLAAFDLQNAVKETVKALPDLFIGAAVPAAAGAALQAGRLAVDSTALLALGCGLTADFVKNLVGQARAGQKKRKSAKFLTYPLNLRKALDAP